MEQRTNGLALVWIDCRNVDQCFHIRIMVARYRNDRARVRLASQYDWPIHPLQGSPYSRNVIG
jgi:hypothetical protein